jgi:RimK family alpha-L-glutamate ligase
MESSMRIGVFGNLDSWYVNELCQHGERRHHVMLPLQFQQFSSRIAGGQPQFQCGDHELKDLDVALVRTMPPGSLEQVVARMDLLGGLSAIGIRVVNSPRALECAVDKYLTTQRLALAGLPVPSTVVCENAESALAAFEQLGCDVVVKPLFGAEGRGIIRVSDPELAMRAFRTIERLGAVLYLQQFIDGPGFDIRVLVLDGQLVGSMKRIPRAGDFRANISQQGTGTPHVPTSHELQLAYEAAEATGCLFAGVDIMYDRDGQPMVIEVNAVPGWRGLQKACGIDVPDALFRWLESGSSW